MSVYVDDCFVEGDWGKWTGGGHMQADTEAELHDFAASIGLRRDWYQGRIDRPERSHYDLTRSKRDVAILAGAIPESASDGRDRRRAARDARRAALSSPLSRRSEPGSALFERGEFDERLTTVSSPEVEHAELPQAAPRDRPPTLTLSFDSDEDRERLLAELKLTPRRGFDYAWPPGSEGGTIEMDFG